MFEYDEDLHGRRGTERERKKLGVWGKVGITAGILAVLAILFIAITPNWFAGIWYALKTECWLTGLILILLTWLVSAFFEGNASNKPKILWWLMVVFAIYI